MQRLRLAYCIDTFDIGGTELNAVRTLERLDRDLLEVKVFHLQEGGPLFERYEKLGVEMVHTPISGFASVATALQGVRIARQMSDWGAQIVHCHDVYSNVFFAPPARALTSACIITSRRWWDALPRRGLAVLNRLSYARSHHVLANCRAVATMLKENERVPGRKVVEIPNFLDESAFEGVSLSQILRIRRGWGVPDGVFMIGMVARLSPVKNQEQLISAVARLPPDCHVVFVGGGESLGGLQEHARRLGIPDRVHFAGPVLSSMNMHACFDVSVLCSLSEGFPNTVIEALAASRPVIATPVGGVMDVIQHERTGLLVEVGDDEGLAREILRLKVEREFADLLGKEGRRTVLENYTSDVVIKAVHDLYRTVVRRPRYNL